MSQRQPIYIGSDADIFVDGLIKASTRTYELEATLAVTLYDATSAVVSGASALSMTLKSGSNGNYVVVIPRAVTVLLTDQANYTAVITGTNPGLQWELPLKAVKRTQ